jgi:hypothetical protein
LFFFLNIGRLFFILGNSLFNKARIPKVIANCIGIAGVIGPAQNAKYATAMVIAVLVGHIKANIHGKKKTASTIR